VGVSTNILLAHFLQIQTCMDPALSPLCHLCLVSVPLSWTLPSAPKGLNECVYARSTWSRSPCQASEPNSQVLIKLEAGPAMARAIVSDRSRPPQRASCTSSTHTPPHHRACSCPTQPSWSPRRSPEAQNGRAQPAQPQLEHAPGPYPC
jgi:hypothetical protein